MMGGLERIRGQTTTCVATPTTAAGPGPLHQADHHPGDSEFVRTLSRRYLREHAHDREGAKQQERREPPVIQASGRPDDKRGGYECERMEQHISTARLPCAHVASRGTFAIHRPLFIDRDLRTLNPECVQADVDGT